MEKNILGFATAQETMKFTLICLGMFVAGHFFFSVWDVMGLAAMITRGAECVKNQFKNIKSSYMKEKNMQFAGQLLIAGGIFYFGMRTLAGFYCVDNKVEFGVAYMPFEYADADEAGAGAGAGASVEAHMDTAGVNAAADYRSALNSYLDNNF